MNIYIKYALDIEQYPSLMSRKRIISALRKCHKIWRKNYAEWKALQRDSDIRRGYDLLPDMCKKYSSNQEIRKAYIKALGKKRFLKFIAFAKEENMLSEENDRLDEIILMLRKQLKESRK